METHRTLEICLAWGDTILQTLDAGDRPIVTIGDAPKIEGFGPLARFVPCDLDLPSRGLPAARYPIAISSGTGSWRIAIHESFGGTLLRKNGACVPIAEVMESIGVERGELPGTWMYPLADDETLYLAHGELTLQLRYVKKTRFVPMPLLERLNYSWLNVLILAAFAHALTIAAFLTAPSKRSGDDDELLKSAAQFIHVSFTPEKQRPRGEDGALAKAIGKEGEAGKRDLPRRAENRMMPKGIKKDDATIARSALSALIPGGRRAPSDLFGTGGLGGDLSGALGGVTGPRVGLSGGLEGLGSRGPGPGGGGLSMRDPGLGDLDTKHGGDPGWDHAGSLGKKIERDFEITPGVAVVEGGLEKNLIRIVVDRHKSQIRYCYEKELVRTPGLFGKIQVEWVIAPDGSVRDATVKESTLQNVEVERCIAARIRTWIFPKPRGGGVVIVRYPFVLKSSG
jgi:hypothetical protein